MTRAILATVAASEPSALLLLLKATALLLSALCVAACLQRSSAARRHFVWFVALGASVVLAALQAFAPAISISVASDSVLRGVSAVAAPTEPSKGALQRASGSKSTIALQQREGFSPEPSIVSDTISSVSAATSDALNAHSFAPNTEREVSNDALRDRHATNANANHDNQYAATATHAAHDVHPRHDTTRDRPVAESVAHTPVLALAVIWLCGALVVVGRFMIARQRLTRIVQTSTGVNSNAWTHDATKLATQLRIKPVRLLQHRDVTTPFTAGWLRPIILLPNDVDHWNAERRRAVLTHEMAHVARADYLALCVSTIACALYWFHPAVWMAAYFMRNEGERAADDAVMNSGMPAVQYAEHLLALANNSASMDMTPVALGMARLSQLEGRIRAMLDASRSRVSLSRKFTRATGAFCTAALVPLGAIRTEVRSDVQTRPLVIAVATLPRVAIVERAEVRPTEISSGRSTAEESFAVVPKALAIPMPLSLPALPANASEPLTLRHDPIAAAVAEPRQVFDSTFERTVPVTAFGKVRLDMEVRVEGTLHRWDKDSVKMQVKFKDSFHLVSLESKDTLALIHTFNSDRTLDESARFEMNLWIPRNARFYETLTRENGFSTPYIDKTWLRQVADSSTPKFDSLATASVFAATSQRTSNSRNDTTYVQSISANSGASLMLSLPFGGDIILHSWDSSSVKMRATLGGEHWRDTGVELARTPDGVRLTSIPKSNPVALRGNLRTYTNPFNDRFLTNLPAVVQFELWVPHRTIVRWDTGNGSLTVRDFEGSISGQTRNGGIDMQNVRGSASVTTSRGPITVSNSALVGTVTTQCGPVQLSNNTGALLGQSNGGAPSSVSTPSDPLVYIDGAQQPRAYCSIKRF